MGGGGRRGVGPTPPPRMVATLKGSRWLLSIPEGFWMVADDYPDHALGEEERCWGGGGLGGRYPPLLLWLSAILIHVWRGASRPKSHWAVVSCRCLSLGIGTYRLDIGTYCSGIGTCGLGIARAARARGIFSAP